ncbi:hypothetical protein LFM09_07110 [Lentzea alba]|uniref:hypothetical protein n=1 Tax=Lentzea alba TaxID=2714351 RepID=UPI0039BF8811
MRAGVFLRWVAHPLTVGATAVLLLNDHVFKQAWPGLVTGKLSDFAGLVVAPAVLGLLSGLFRFGRIGAAAATLLTGAGFAWVKLTSIGAEVASAAWSVVNGPSVILADPTDLVALPALGLAWWAWRRVADAPPLPDRLAHRVRVVVALPFAVLAIAATSPPADTLPSVNAIQPIAGDQVMIEVGGEYYSSPSGVGDWTHLPGTPPEHLPGRGRQLEACAPDDEARCYRVHGGDLDFPARQTSPDRRRLGVDETTDGGQTWRTAWDRPATRWPFIVRQHLLPNWTDGSRKVASVELVVRAVPGGHQVIVANGMEGLAVRSADGVWQQVPVVIPATGLDIRPAPLTAFGQGIGDYVIDAGLITVLALLVGMSIAGGRARPRPGRWLPVLLPLGLLLVASVPIAGAVVFSSDSAAKSTGTGLVFALCLIGAAAGLVLAQRMLPRPRTAVVVAAAVLTGLAFLGPVLSWTVGHPPEHGPAVQLGLILAAVCLVPVVAAGWWAGRRTI